MTYTVSAATAKLTLKFNAPSVEDSAWTFSRTFQLGGVGLWTLERSFEIQSETPSFSFARTFAIVEEFSAYLPTKSPFSAHLLSQANPGDQYLLLSSTASLRTGMALQLNPPYGERAHVTNVVRNVAYLSGSLAATYQAATVVVEANIYAPTVSVFDKHGVLLGSIEYPNLTDPPSYAINTPTTMKFAIARNSTSRALIEDGRVVLVGNGLGLPAWAGVITSHDWGEGSGEASCSDMLTEVFRNINVTFKETLPDRFTGAMAASVLLNHVNNELASDGQIRWSLNGSGQNLYHGDMEVDGKADQVLSDLVARANIEFIAQYDVAGGRLYPTLIVKDKIIGPLGVTLSDENSPRPWRDTVLAIPDLTAFWRLSDPTAASDLIAADELWGYDGTYARGPTYGVPGLIANDSNAAVSLGGSGASVMCGAVPEPWMQPFSVFGWVNPNLAGATQTIASQGNTGAGRGWTLQISANVARFMAAASGTRFLLTGSAPIQVGVPAFVAITVDRNRGVASLYVNGVLDAALPFSLGSIDSTVGQFIIGGTAWGQSTVSWLNGMIDEVGMVMRDLSADEVLEMYRSGIGASTVKSANLIDQPRWMRDSSTIVNAVKVTGAPTDLASLVPSWMSWAVHEVTPETTVALDMSQSENRLIYDDTVTVPWSLSHAQQRELADATKAAVWTLFRHYLAAFHDRYGRPYGDGWKFNGIPTDIVRRTYKDKKGATVKVMETFDRRSWVTRLELIEYKGQPASLVMASTSGHVTSPLHKWLIVTYDRFNDKQSVIEIPPTLGRGPAQATATFKANGGPKGGQYVFYTVSGGVYTGYQLVSISPTATYSCDASFHTIGTASIPKLKLAAHASVVGAGAYHANQNILFRAKPSANPNRHWRLLKNASFVVRQRITTGPKIAGSRVWYGNYDGTRWAHKSWLDYDGPIVYAPRTLRRILSGPYQNLWFHDDTHDGVTLTVKYTTTESGSNASSENVLIGKMYPFEEQSIGDWDPRTAGVGALIAEPTVFFGKEVKRARWQIVPWAEAAGGSTQLLSSITASQTSIEVESYISFGTDRTDFIATIGAGNAAEDVLVTGVNGNVLTVKRGRNQTPAIVHLSGETLAEKDPPQFGGLVFDYAWPEGQAWASEYLSRIASRKPRLTLAVSTDVPTGIGHMHPVRLSTEGPGPKYTDLVAALGPSGYWPMEERASFSTQLIGSGAEAYWSLDEDDGSVAANGGYSASNDGTYGYPATYVGSPTLGADGLITNDTDSAVVLNGNGQYLSVPDSSPFRFRDQSPFMAYVAINCTPDGVSRRILACSNGTGTNYGGWNIYGSTAGIGFQRRSSGGTETLAQTNVLPSGTTDILATFDGTQMRLYVNGAEITGSPLASSRALPNDGTFLIGRLFGSSPANSYDFSGTVDEPTLWNSIAADPAAFAASLHAGLKDGTLASKIAASGPLVWWRLNEIDDSSTVALAETPLLRYDGPFDGMQDLAPMFQANDRVFGAGVQALGTTSSVTVGCWFNSTDSGVADLVADYDASAVDHAYSLAPTLGSANVLAADTSLGITCNGSGQWANCGTSVPGPSTAISVSAWFKTTYSGGSSNRLFGRLITNGCSWQMYTAGSGQVAFVAHQSSGALCATAVSPAGGYNDGAWHHAVGTFDGDTIIIYVDGVEAGRSTTVTGTWYVGTNGRVGIGGDANYSYGLGSLSEAVIWNRALSGQDVTDMWDAAWVNSKAFMLSVVQKAPVAYWRLGEPSGTTATDYMGLYNGTYSGSPTLAVPGPMQAFAGDAGSSMLSNGITGVTLADSADMNAGSGSLTVGLWTKFSGASNYTLFRRSDASNVLGWILSAGTLAPGRIRWQIDNTALNLYTDSPLAYNTNTWHFVVGVLDRSTDKATLYIDGVAVGTPASIPHGTNLTGSLTRTLGTVLGNTQEAFVTQAALSDTQIASLYAAAASGRYRSAMLSLLPSGGYWRLNEPAGATVAADDAARGARNGYRLGIGHAGAGLVRWQVSDVTAVDSSAQYNDGGWHFAFGTLDRSHNWQRLYIDGVLVGQTDLTIGANLTPTAKTHIGGGMVGQIAQAFIAKRAFSEAQATALYLSGRWTADWSFPDTDGDGVPDVQTTGGKIVAAAAGPDGSSSWATFVGVPGPIWWDPTSHAIAAPDSGTGNITIPNSSSALDPGAGSFTVAGWFMWPKGAIAAGWSAGKGDPYSAAEAGWAIANTNPTDTPVAPAIYISDGSTWSNANGAAAERGVWTHYAFVVDRTNGYIFPYTNGVLGASISILVAGPLTNAHDMTLLGARSGTSSGTAMSHFAYFPRALTEDEIASLVSAVATPSTVPVQTHTVRVLGMKADEMGGGIELLAEVM